MPLSDRSNSQLAAEIDVQILRELMEAGNELARLVDLEFKAERVDDNGALNRWDAALFAVAKAVTFE